MKKFYFLVLFSLFSIGFGQTVQLYNPDNGENYSTESYFCADEKFNFKVDAVASSTGDYAVTKAFASDYGLSAGSIPITFPGSGADNFSASFSIGFDFSFYGKIYSKVVAGSNGRLVFTNDSELDNLKNNATYKDRTFSGIAGYNSYTKLPSKDYNKVYVTNPTQELNLAQIFFGYTDLVPKSKNGSVTYLYKNVVFAGVKGLMISFQNQIRTNGVGGDSSTSYYSYILLLEDGRIIISVYSKSETTYNAILGIQNDDASKFKVPTHSNTAYDYNNGRWNSEGTAFVFTPNQNLTPVFKWTNNGNIIGTNSDSLNDFTPIDGDVLKVEVTYLDDDGLQVGAAVSDQIVFKSLPKAVITSGSGGGCVSGVTMTVENDPDLNFQWFRVGNATVLGVGNSYYATETGSYYARSFRNTSPTCAVDSDPFAVNLSSTIPRFNANNVSLNYCESSGASSKTINLYDYYPLGSNYSLSFIDGVTPVIDPTNFILYASTIRTVGIYANDPVSGCTVLRNFDLRFDSLPSIVNNLEKRFCFGATAIDVSQYLQDLAGVNFSVFNYQYSTDGVTFSTNTVINPQVSPTIWVKISPQNVIDSNCTTVSTIIFTEDNKVLANTPTTQLPPQCASATQTFNLYSLIPEINSDPNGTVSFHTTLQNARNGIAPVNYDFQSGLDYTTLYVRVKNNITGCVSPDHPEISLLVYQKPTLIVNAITKELCQGITVTNITQRVTSIVNALSPITVDLEYFSTDGTLLTATQITNYDLARFGLTPYLKVVYNSTCNDTIPIIISFLPKPTSLKSQILVCSELNYSLENFKNEVINNSADYTFTDLSDNSLPAKFDLSILPLTVSFLMKDNTTGCISEPQTLTFKKNSNSALMTAEIDYSICETDFDGKTSFNLDSKRALFTNDATAVFEYFKDADLTQSISSNYSNETAFTQTIFARITIPSYCPSIGKIILKVNTPIKSSTLKDQYDICFGETLTIDVGSENTIFAWSNGQTGQTGTFTEAGTYSVILKSGSNGCPYTHNFTISDENQPKIKVIDQTNNSIEVIAEGGVKPYRYYFNGIPQTTNILLNPTASSYVIQVESKTGCIGPPKTIYFIKINNAFSPNADGINDIWKIDNLDQMERVSIVIVDRNGTKVFESVNSNKVEWDGKHNNRTLPTSTYWYTVSWYDPVSLKSEQRQGWILMKNRN